MKTLFALCFATLFFAHTATSFADCGCNKGKGKGKGKKFCEATSQNYSSSSQN
jgi:hypothetical protein